MVNTVQPTGATSMWMELVLISVTASLATGSLDSALKQAFRETYLVKREARDGNNGHPVLICEMRDTLHEIPTPKSRPLLL